MVGLANEEGEALDPLWRRLLDELDALALGHPAFAQFDAFVTRARTRQASREEAARTEAEWHVLEAQLADLRRDHVPSLEYLELDCAGWTPGRLPIVGLARARETLTHLDALLAQYRAAWHRVQNARTRTERVASEHEEEALVQRARALHADLTGLFAGEPATPSPETSGVPMDPPRDLPALAPPVTPGPVTVLALVPSQSTERTPEALPDLAPLVSLPLPPSDTSALVAQAEPDAQAGAAARVDPPPLALPAQEAPRPPLPPVASNPEPSPAVAVSPGPRPAPARLPRAKLPVPAPAAEPLASGIALPDFSEDLISWEAFRAARWVRPGETRSEPAPWSRADFGERLTTFFDGELIAQHPRFWLLYLLVAAAHREGPRGLPSAEQVRELALLWSEPSLRPAMRKPRRDGALEEESATDGLAKDPSWRARVFLVVVCHGLEAPLAQGEAARLVESVGFKNKDLETVLTAMLDFAGYGEDPIDRLRALIPRGAIIPVDPRVELEQRRLDFKALVKKNSPAGGGKIQRTHCRKAWSDFIHKVSPILYKFYPVSDGGREQWKPGELSGDIARITELHEQCADRGGAKLGDRMQMDRLAAGFARMAAEIDGLMQRLHQRASVMDVSPRGDKLPVEALRRLLTGDALAGDEEFYRTLLVRSLHPPPQQDGPDPLAIPFQALCAWPELLLALPPVEGPPGELTLTALDVTDPRLAASLLMEPPSQVELGEGVGPLLEALEDPSRQHLLLRVVAQLPNSMRERAHLQAARGTEQVYEALSRLRQVGQELGELASPMLESLHRICREAEALLEPSGADAGPGAATLDPMRMRLWLEGVEHEAIQARDTLVERLRADALAHDGEEGECARRALEMRRYAMALGALRGMPVAPVSERRVTLWRHDARLRFPEPSRTLRESGVPLPRWLEGIQGSSQATNQDRAVRTEFARLFLGALYEASAKQQTEVSLLCADIREEIDQRGLNPSYVPQLSRFRALVVPSISVSPAATHFVEAAASSAAIHRDNLVVLLAPGITERVRQSLIEELASRKLTAAVFDDLDLCRLLNPGGQRPNGVLGVLELLLEQQRWSAVTPFSRHEGQHVHLEMYVGRDQEARDLAFSADYSRLFSGRKMGKSALLRVVESRFDGELLPDGSRLRVIYVSAVGIEQAGAMVERIIEALVDRARAREAWLPDEDLPQAAADVRLERFIRRYLEQHPGVSLLLVLDEADTFVEQELVEYEARREACLSFFMRSRLTTGGGALQGLPRVRFVFTGYRVTNTSEGAWGNWGKVLRLEPLQVDDAAGLVAGPLARLGIDATEQAAVIAHRCGYQPAVILQFGERLLARLEERHPAKLRLHQKPVVTAQDVVSTFEDVQVQEEIRAVAKNNFQGNPAGRVVFHAVLNELLLRSPMEALTDAESRLHHRLEQLGGDDWSWLRSEGETVEGELSRHLGDMVDRQLLLSRRGPSGQSEYLLRFPHHLTVLAPLAREEVMRADIRALRQARTAGRVGHTGQALLGRHGLQSVRSWLESPPDPEMMGVPVVATLWRPELFASQGREGALLARGLLDRLGMDQTTLLDARSTAPLHDKRLERAGPLALLGPSWTDVPPLLARRGPSRSPPLLVGGVDLLRGALQSFGPLEGSPHTEVLFDPHPLGRLGRGALSWWFERARGINFAEAGAIDRILEHTSGIPLLVAELDGLLMRRDPEGSGLDVNDSLLREVLAQLDGELPRLARQLREGPACMRLEARELALLQMACALARLSPESSPKEGLSDYWPLLREELEPAWRVGREFSAVDAADAPALTLLQDAGLLPIRPDELRSDPLSRLAPLAPEDALPRLMDALQAD